ncbi:hypothetical protein KAFR_0A02800 [Kazachstania africana CBS 2517]|uniref:CTD kinase subunit gamma Ctk3 C-terminal domain-containing protein n=1 Tax=Kazachstania africana (strain ATCC 22294 / BCRC 22015 / CBS 2517 / CECT 1963 / NBRC 1671 / NRRL Y-8276) TaxID=1071382 RepID=H2AMW6_KAZAF|nr:hypothetical protein KAFR_0A02800 [Kazachstania africana CBS 2517]CCF55716.1 hypothetical protein KAFR_0A02800 [Kazachstania africana CBS 2517]
MDAIEARLQFIQILKTITKQPTAVDFYFNNYKHHYEDFEQCIIDTMSKTQPVLNRLNILLYYVELIVGVLERLNMNQGNDFNFMIFIKFQIPNLVKIIRLSIIQEDIFSFVNLQNVVDAFAKIKHALQTHVNASLMEEAVVKSNFQELETFIQEMCNARDAKFEQYTKNTTIFQEETISQNDVLNRMEADRERHKRTKESNWIVERATLPNDSNKNVMLQYSEFDSMWNGTNKIDEVDMSYIRQLNEISTNSSYVVR